MNSRDNLTGTDGNDTFYAEVGQNQDGAIANAFATGDVIDGGAGSKDTLEAAIMNDNEVDGADEDAQATLAADVADIVADYEAAYPDGGEPTEPEEKDGETYFLTSSTDRDLGNTEDNDTYNAYIEQNPFAGGVSNSLSSADHLDGGAGTDTLYAELVQEFVGVTAIDNNDIKPNTTDIEIVEFNNIDDDTTVTIDAKNMNGVEKIGSVQSDGDLVIENLTTLKDDGESARNTSDMTITMDHTDNFNSDGDASDLTVYFDNDYLISDRTDDSAQVFYEVMNQDAWDLINLAGRTDVELLDGVVFGQLSFTLNGEKIDLTDYLHENGDDLAIRTHQDMADAINDALTELGISDKVTATVGKDFTERTAVQTGDERTAPTVILTSTSGNTIEATEDDMFVNAVPQDERDVPASNRYDRAGDQEIEGQDNPLSVNVDLFKVGRAGEGGNLIIGAKDDAEGINQFDIDVLGNAAQYSNLGSITSTGGALTHVNVETHADDAKRAAATTVADREEVAALIVRGIDGAEDVSPFGGTLERFDANNFLGDLTIGEDTPAVNIDTFTATGGGNVTLTENIGAVNGTTGSFSSDDSNEYSVTTGAGSDIITIDANSGAQLTVTTGGGDDEITVTIDGQDDSGSDLTTATISSTSGNNIVDVTSSDSNHSADIDLGSGSDTVGNTKAGNTVSLTVDTGAGDDVIYADNTGDKAQAVLAATTYSSVATPTLTNMNDSQFLNGREVTVTVAVPETSTAATDLADDFTNGYEIKFDFKSAEELSTELEFYNAIADEINADPVVNKLVEASVDSQGKLTVTYLVDGLADDNTNLVEIKVSDEYANATEISDKLLAAVREDQGNSSISKADILAAYDGVNTVGYAATGASAAQAATIVFDVNTLTDGDDVTFTVNGETATLPTGASIETSLNNLTVTIDGIEYLIDGTTANQLTLTATSATDYTIAVAADATIIDETLGAGNEVDSTSVTSGVASGPVGSNSTAAVNNTVNGGQDDDVIVLSSNDAQVDTVVFDAGGFGDDTIVHFESTPNGDKLDFTDFLNGQESPSGSVDSRADIAQTLNTNAGVEADSVTIIAAADVSFNTTDTWDGLTGNTLKAAINSTNTGADNYAGILEGTLDAVTTYTASGVGTDLVGGIGHAIVMIENDDNLGEYKVFELTFDGTGTNTDADFTNVTLVGSVDFGESLAATFDDTNLA